MIESSEGILLSVEWMTLLAHWFHVVAAAMWIGASFYIMSWENKFNRAGLRDGIAGEFWTIQGGDFYFVEKLETAPEKLPEPLHWFKYEAYLTWASGFLLLCLVFYVDARTMIDPSVLDLTPALAISVSIGSLVVFWLLYDGYCRTPFARNPIVSAGVGVCFVAFLSYLFSAVYGQRAAYVHVGAVLGTMMAGNVFFAIIPWHRRFIDAIAKKQPLDELLRERPGYRSRHNHYMTLPVFFIMLSSHFPVLFGHSFAWVLLPMIALAGGLIKHCHNLWQQNEPRIVYFLVGLAIFICAAAVSSFWNRAKLECKSVATAHALEVVTERCSICHASNPTHKIWTEAPNGVIFETAPQLAEHRERIYARAVVTRTMPPPGEHPLTEAERATLACWIKGTSA